jgi:chorismate synthase
MFKKLIARLKEPSTMAGLSALMMIAGVPPGVGEGIGHIVAGVLAVAAVLVPEAKAE